MSRRHGRRPPPSAADLYRDALCVYRPEGVGIWFVAVNPHLDGARPIELLDTSKGRARIYRALLAMAEGVAT